MHADIVIIGAGPAGLSLARELTKRGLHPLLLEKGQAAGHSWDNMPQRLKLLSPWTENGLPGTRYSYPKDLFKLVNAKDFARYMQEYCKEVGAKLKSNANVKSVRQAGAGEFEIDLGSEKVTCKHLVNATGYFSNPLLPNFNGAKETAIKQIHFNDYYNPEQITKLTGKQKPSVLVVGKKVSAGQVVMELFEAGFPVSVSHRSPIVFAPSLEITQILFPFYYVYENLLVKLNKYYKDNSFPNIEGGPVRRLITSGKIPLRGNIARFDKDRIHFEDSSIEHFDIVIYTTGYRPALSHLGGLVEVDQAGNPVCSGFESRKTPHLYFLGIDGIRSFRSRYLRGIREDAAALAEILKESR